MKAIAKIALASALTPWAAAAQAKEASSTDWQFATTMYVWVSDLEGDLRTAGEVEPVAVDLSYGDVLEHLKFAGMGAFQARKGRLIFMADLSYVHLGADKTSAFATTTFWMQSSTRRSSLGPRSPAIARWRTRSTST